MRPFFRACKLDDSCDRCVLASIPPPPPRLRRCRLSFESRVGSSRVESMVSLADDTFLPSSANGPIISKRRSLGRAGGCAGVDESRRRYDSRLVRFLEYSLSISVFLSVSVGIHIRTYLLFRSCFICGTQITNFPIEFKRGFLKRKRESESLALSFETFLNGTKTLSRSISILFYSSYKNNRPRGK